VKINRLFVAIGALSVFLLPALAKQHAKTLTNTEATPTDAQVMHVLNRLTFGPRPGDVEAVKKMGIPAFIETQLNPQSIPQAQEVTSYVQSHDSLSMSPPQLFLTFARPVQQAVGAAAVRKQGNSEDAQGEVAKVAKKNYGQVIEEFSAEHIARAEYSPRQLEEVMTDFWFNHFNVSKDKGLDHVWVGAFEDQAIRPHALGHFRDLLEATAHHPAMLFYLDNWQNSAPGSEPILQGKKGKKVASGINENYARELMELHTLGVDGGYTQQDVIALAHILTGLGLPARRDYRTMGDASRITYVFNERRHDFSTKNFLGKSVPGSGEREIEYALDVLAAAPQTAHHVSYKLVQYFIADDPPPAAVTACAQTFERTNGDIKAVLRTLFSRPEFWDPQYDNAKFKSPQRYLISALRASQISPQEARPLLGFLVQTGEPLYGCLTPDGYKNTKDAWVNPDGLLKRISLATAISTGRLPAAIGQQPDPRQVMDAIGKEVKPKTLVTVAQAPQNMQSALLLGSPEFMKY
jgi:uncharacterized protein (DUF1800 family)